MYVDEDVDVDDVDVDDVDDVDVVDVDVDDVDDVDVVDDDTADDDDNVDEMRKKTSSVCPNERHGESHKTLALRSQNALSRAAHPSWPYHYI